MAIEDRNLEPGTKLIAKYKKEGYKAEVIAGEDGKVKYRLADGREFKSPSSAGTAITNKACNGWAFWSVEAGGAPSEAEEPEGERILPEPPFDRQKRPKRHQGILPNTAQRDQIQTPRTSRNRTSRPTKRPRSHQNGATARGTTPASQKSSPFRQENQVEVVLTYKHPMGSLRDDPDERLG